jgi:GT2 family glycosyltransferase
MRREALEAVGGWDETMGWGHEEKELAERLLREYPIYYNPEMVVDHVYAESLFNYWHKQYRLEKGTPHYLLRQGASERQIALKIFKDLFTPSRYVRKSPRVTLALSGRQIAAAAGRVAGLAEERAD